MTMLAATLAMAAMLSLDGHMPPDDLVLRVAQQEPARPAAKRGSDRPAKPAAKGEPAKAPANGVVAGAGERRIGEVTVVDMADAPFLRLDGPWRERGYELRTWLTSYVYRPGDIRPPFHTLTVQVTHHDEEARNYGLARSEKDDALGIAVATRPNRQCIRNRDNTRLCFFTEAYTVTVPEELLAAARAKGLTLRLGADAREPLAVTVDAATVAAQLRAEQEVAAKK